MAEYIEREAAISVVRRLISPNKSPAQREMIRTAEIGLQRIRAADVAPVVNGEWIFKWDSEKDPRRLFVRIVCSECNLHTGQKSTYCPNCGAKMDGERKEGEG